MVVPMAVAFTSVNSDGMCQLRFCCGPIANPQRGDCLAAGWCDVRDGSAVWVGLCCGSVICSRPTRSEGSRCLRVGVVFVTNPQFVRGGALLLLRVCVSFVTDLQRGDCFAAGWCDVRDEPAV